MEFIFITLRLYEITPNKS